VAYMLGSLCMGTGIRGFSLDGIVDSTFPLTGNNYEGIRFIFFPVSMYFYSRKKQR
jgi:hypothetical protein